MVGERMADEEMRDEVCPSEKAPTMPVSSDEELYLTSHCLFSGSYTHGLDGKGRMIVPACFRRRLGEKFVCAPSPDFQSIALYPLSEWIHEQDELEKKLKEDARMERLIAYFNKYSFPESETDVQGRLLLPVRLRQRYLGDARNLEISGSKRYVRVVSTECGEEEDEKLFLDFPDPLAFMAQIGRKD